MTETEDRCMAQALLPGGGDWKSCIRARAHRGRHVWLESYALVGGRPIVVTWMRARDTEPLVAEVLLPIGPVLDGMDGTHRGLRTSMNELIDDPEVPASREEAADGN